MRLLQGRINADPEGVIHHTVGIHQVIRNPIIAADHIRLTCQIAGEQQTGTHLLLIQILQQFHPAHRRIVTQGNGEAEPGGRCIGSRFGQDQEVLATAQSVFEEREVAAAGLDETLQPIHLGKRAGSLHVADLEVIA